MIPVSLVKIITNHGPFLLLIYRSSLLLCFGTNVMLHFSFATTMLCFNSTNRKKN